MIKFVVAKSSVAMQRLTPNYANNDFCFFVCFFGAHKITFSPGHVSAAGGREEENNLGGIGIRMRFVQELAT